MSETNINAAERQVAEARSRVERDIDLLERQIRFEKERAKAKVKENVPLIAGAAAAAGLIVGFGGKHAVKLLVGAGIAASAALFLRRK